MHAHVAIRAVLVARVGHVVRGRQHKISGPRASKVAGAVMAFEAERENNWTAEEAGICRAVRIVAHFATFYADGRMFKGERAAFIGVAFEARFLVSERLSH